jgi:tetratricopeptide (TPR) repeat protein
VAARVDDEEWEEPEALKGQSFMQGRDAQVRMAKLGLEGGALSTERLTKYGLFLRIFLGMLLAFCGMLAYSGVADTAHNAWQTWPSYISVAASGTSRHRAHGTSGGGDLRRLRGADASEAASRGAAGVSLFTHPSASGHAGNWWGEGVPAAARRAVAGLRLRVARRREARTVGNLSTERDAAQVEVLVAEAEAQVRQQQLDAAAASFEGAVFEAERLVELFKERRAGRSAVSDALQTLGTAYMRLGAFRLTHGHAQLAREMLGKAVGVLGDAGGGVPSWHARTLEASAMHAAGELGLAAVALEDLLAELRADAMAADAQPALDAEVALALDELARIRLDEDRPDAAQELVTEALSRVPRGDPGQQLLAAQLLGHLGAAHLKAGRPQRALEATDEALAMLASSSPLMARPAGVPSGLAAASSGSIQEIMQIRAGAKVALAQCGSAQEDLDTVLRLQDELWVSIRNAREQWRASPGGETSAAVADAHPDPRLRGAMARSRLVAGTLALDTACFSSDHGSPRATAEQAAQQALKILQTVESGELPVGPEIATSAEAHALLDRARKASVAEVGLPGKSESMSANAAAPRASDPQARAAKGGTPAALAPVAAARAG